MSSNRDTLGYGSIEVRHPRGDEGHHELEVDADSLSEKSVDNHRNSLTSTRRLLGIVGGVCLLSIVYSVAIRGHGKVTSGGVHYDGTMVDEPFYYKEQTLDHFTPNKDEAPWAQRYYQDDKYFAGPGHPIFVIMGGEDAVNGILYPFVSKHLAKRFRAHTLCLEHRFYGKSKPLKHPSTADLRRLLSPAQALADAVQFIEYKRKQLGCGNKGTKSYCPVVTVGGSYPGFLSALLRIVYPDVVDIGYASSAPLHLYSHRVNKAAYFEKVTQVAEQASRGCAGAVKNALMDVTEKLLASKRSVAEVAFDLGVCVATIPDYIMDNEIFQQEIMMVVSTHFAEYNMGYYPPGPDQDLVQGCLIFQDTKSSSEQKVSNFLRLREDFDECFDMQTELPPGPNGTISASDWSGVGDGHSGYMWDFQSCTLLPECGMSDASMFPPRPWTIEWETQHCQVRFGVEPNLRQLVDEFGFADLSNVTHLLFTNGINDGWSVASILTDLSESVKAINFVNGAHHSDLSHVDLSEHDTEDIKAGHAAISDLLHDWLNRV
jgi:pimeloyl-ACP methyl ester carboxylesterase